jgi:hypothetical protein
VSNNSRSNGSKPMLTRNIDDYKQVIADGVKHVSSHHDPERFAERWFKDEVLTNKASQTSVPVNTSRGS